MFNNKQRKCLFKSKKKMKIRIIFKRKSKNWKIKLDKLRKSFKSQLKRPKTKLNKTYILNNKTMKLLFERHNNLHKNINHYQMNIKTNRSNQMIYLLN